MFSYKNLNIVNVQLYLLVSSREFWNQRGVYYFSYSTHNIYSSYVQKYFNEL